VSSSRSRPAKVPTRLLAARSWLPALAEAKHRKCAVAAAKLDRLSRDVYEGCILRCLWCTDFEANLITLCCSCHHKMHQRQMNGEYSHSELVTAAQARARAKGKRIGRRTYDVLYAGAVPLARQLRQERMSLRQISNELFARGHGSPKGRPIGWSTVALMLEGVPEPGHRGGRPRAERPEAVALARRLRQERLSLRQIANELLAAGHAQSRSRQSRRWSRGC